MKFATIVFDPKMDRWRILNLSTGRIGPFVFGFDNKNAASKFIKDIGYTEIHMDTINLAVHRLNVSGELEPFNTAKLT